MTENTKQSESVFREVPEGVGYFIDWSEAAAEFLRKNKFKSVQIQGHFSSLSFLSEYADHLEELVITNDTSIYSGVESLMRLRRLHANSKAKKAIEFDKLQFLEECSVTWNKQYAHTLFSLPLLKQLLISSYGEQNFCVIGTNVSLKELRIIGTSIEDFRGIGALSKLEFLWLQGTTKLKSFDGIEDATGLKALRVEDAKKVESCDSIGRHRALESLTLMNTSGLENLDFLYPLRSLKVLNLPTALLVNVDWRRLIGMLSLERLWVASAKENMPSEDEVRKFAAACNKNIVGLEWQGTLKKPRLKLHMTIKSS